MTTHAKDSSTTSPRQSSSQTADADLSTDLIAPVSPTTTEHAAAEAQRAMEHTQAWKPKLDRRQSWDNQEHKRELQMSSIDNVKTGPGFTEENK